MYLAQDEISIKTGDEINRKLVAAMRSKNVKAVRNIIRENKNIEVAINYELETVIDIVDMANDIITIINSFDILEKSKEEISNIISEKLFDVLDSNEKQYISEIEVDNLFKIFELASSKEHINDTLITFLELEKGNKDILKTGENIKTYLDNKDILAQNVDNKFKSYIIEMINKNVEELNKMLGKITINKDTFYEYFGVELLNDICSFFEITNNFTDNIISIEKFKEYCTLLEEKDLLKECFSNMIPLFKYNELLSVLDEIFTEEVCQKIETSISNEIVEVLTNSKLNDREVILNIMDKLNFVIDEENSENIDAYMSNNIDLQKAQVVAIKVIGQGKVEFLDTTISKIIDDIFETDRYDEVFEKIIEYLPDEVIEKVYKKLQPLLRFNQSKDYIREIEVYRMLSVAKKEDYIIKYIDSPIISSYRTNYNYPNYFELVYRTMNISKEYILDDTFLEYLKLVIKGYDYYPEKAISAFKLLKGNIPKEILPLLIRKLNEDVNASNCSDIVEILVNNEDSFKSIEDTLTTYLTILLKCIQLSDSPDRIITIIGNSFEYIPEIYELTKQIHILVNINKAKAYSIIAKLIDGEENLNSASNDIAKLLADEELMEECIQVSKRLKKYNGTNVISQIIDNLEEYKNNYKIKGRELIKLSQEYESEILANEISKVLIVEFKNIDNIDYISELSTIIRRYDSKFYKEKKDKEELSQILYECYKSTSSDIIKDNIIELVQHFNIKKVFKEKLDEDELEYYNLRIK